MASAVKIVVDAVDKTKKGLTAPIKNLKDLRTAVDRLKPAFGLAAAAAASAFTAIAKSQINVLDSTSKLSQKLGVSTEALSTLSHASELSGASLEGLKVGLKTLGQRAVDSSRGLKSATDDFDTLGISALDSSGKIKPTEDLFLEVAEAVSKMEDGLEKAGLASKLLGRQGLELIPLLNQGADGIKGMQEEARALGLEIDSNTAKAAEKFNDDLLRLKGLATGVTRTFLSDVLPMLESLTGSMVDAGKGTGALADGFNTLRGLLRGIVREAMVVSSSLDSIGVISQKLGLLFENIKLQSKFAFGAIDGGEYMKQLKVIEQGAWDTSKALESIADKMQRAMDPTLFDKPAASDGGGGGGVAKKAAASSGGESAQLNEVKKFIDAARAEYEKLHYTKLELIDMEESRAKKQAEATITNADELAFATLLIEENAATKRKALAEQETSAITDEYNKLTKTKLELLRDERDARLELIAQTITDTQQRAELEGQVEKVFSEERMALMDAELAKRQEIAEFIAAMEEQAQLGKLDWMAQERQIAEDDHQRNLERIQELAETEADARKMKEAAEKAHEARVIEIARKAADQERAINDLRVSAFQGAMGNMAQAAGAFFGQQSAAFKAFAIAEAIINTYRGANRALAEVPWPVNIAAAAGIIASGIANVAQISGVAHGGITEVPSDQTFLLKKGERVLSPDQNSDFTEMMEGGGGGGNFHITLNLDGQALWDAAGKASRDGRLEISPRAIV